MHQAITTQDDVRLRQFILGDVQKPELPDVIAVSFLVHPNDVWDNINPDILLKFHSISFCQWKSPQGASSIELALNSLTSTGICIRISMV